MSKPAPLRRRIDALYQGTHPAALRLQWLLMVTDIILVIYFLATTFIHNHHQWIVRADYVIGAVLLAEWLLRLWASPQRLAHLSRPLCLVDVLVIASLFAPALVENFAFLRVLRALRLLRSYTVLSRLRSRYAFFQRNEQVIFSATNLLVFIFVVSALVYALQSRHNEQINNYIDALYFTITTLTTTGFGDVIMVGESGRILAILIMIIGVSLFLRLVQSIFRPPKVRYECPDCGLTRHDNDAVHCKHCSRTLHITTSGHSHR